MKEAQISMPDTALTLDSRGLNLVYLDNAGVE